MPFCFDCLAIFIEILNTKQSQIFQTILILFLCIVLQVFFRQKLIQYVLTKLRLNCGGLVVLVVSCPSGHLLSGISWTKAPRTEADAFNGPNKTS